MSSSVVTIVGYVLFGISELLPLIPIPTNGFLHTVLIGLKNSVKIQKGDVEMGDMDNSLKNILDMLKNNKDLKDSLNVLIDNKDLQDNFKYLNSQIISNILVLIQNPRFSNILMSLSNVDNESILRKVEILLDMNTDNKNT